MAGGLVTGGLLVGGVGVDVPPPPPPPQPANAAHRNIPILLRSFLLIASLSPLLSHFRDDLHASRDTTAHSSRATVTSRICKVALDTPLRRLFDYRAPEATPAPGARVRVPFGRQHMTGIVIALATETDVPEGKLR